MQFILYLFFFLPSFYSFFLHPFLSSLWEHFILVTFLSMLFTSFFIFIEQKQKIMSDISYTFSYINCFSFTHFISFLFFVIFSSLREPILTHWYFYPPGLHFDIVMQQKKQKYCQPTQKSPILTFFPSFYHFSSFFSFSFKGILC